MCWRSKGHLENPLELFIVWSEPGGLLQPTTTHLSVKLETGSGWAGAGCPAGHCVRLFLALVPSEGLGRQIGRAHV